MDSPSPPRHRPKPPSLPQQPRKREAFSTSPKPSQELRGAGKKILGINAPKGQAQRRGSSTSVASPRLPLSARGAPGHDDLRTPSEASEAPEAPGRGKGRYFDLDAANAGSANADHRRGTDSARAELIQELNQVQRHAEQARSIDIVAGEAKVRAEAKEREAHLRAELAELRREREKEREELLERIRRTEGERGQREGERDEARAQIADLKVRLEDALTAPERQEARVRALEMENALVRSRFQKEVAAREAAEKTIFEVRAEKEKLQAGLTKSAAEAKQLRRAVAEQAEAVAFRQEVCNDLQARLQTTKTEAEEKIAREKGKMQAIARLEGVLPRSLLVKALG
mmetsp:Transcript_14423/g.36940  ORF Transcript_14423/g.36940 Transcript_14423/m.36940 type:complete len:343 (-) Transcript_14423:67-1095(-)